MFPLHPLSPNRQNGHYTQALQSYDVPVVKTRNAGISRNMAEYHGIWRIIREYHDIFQPRSQGFSLFVIGKAGKGPGTGRSSMYSDWSMTSSLLCKECNLELIYSNFGIN
jgi:hypothetical protein